MKKFKFLVLIFLLNTICYSQSKLNDADFKTPPSSTKVHTWWHWISGNITREGITKDLESMKLQGIETILNKNMPLKPSGIMGPLTIIKFKKVETQK